MGGMVGLAGGVACVRGGVHILGCCLWVFFLLQTAEASWIGHDISTCPGMGGLHASHCQEQLLQGRLRPPALQRPGWCSNGGSTPSSDAACAGRGSRCPTFRMTWAEAEKEIQLSRAVSTSGTLLEQLGNERSHSPIWANHTD